MRSLDEPQQMRTSCVWPDACRAGLMLLLCRATVQCRCGGGNHGQPTRVQKGAAAPPRGGGVFLFFFPVAGCQTEPSPCWTSLPRADSLVAPGPALQAATSLHPPLLAQELARKRRKIPESEFKDGPDGLKYYDIVVGAGAEPKRGDRVAIHFGARRQGLGG